VLGTSVAVTAVAMLGGIGVLPSVASSGQATVSRDTPAAATGDEAELAAAKYASSEQPVPTEAPGSTPTATVVPAAPTEVDVALPSDSGEGRRIVFSQGGQRVWLVDDDGTVERTYLVSGSVYDNLDTGTYSVYSRSKQAWGIDDSGSMRYFVRFTQGDNGGAIGFHDIPVSGGQLVQSKAQLGTAQSHGCIRQSHQDAVALWHFAPVGTEVVVTA
jgi:lipoprotein-anchoring transpeptidase ErfK/SrfK